MNWSDIGKNIIKAAPLLGSALMGPTGGVVGTLIASQFGAERNNPEDVMQKINADPNAVLKLKELELTNQQKLAEIALEEHKATLQDIASARAREVQLAQSGNRDWMPSILALIVTSGFFITFFIIFFTQSDSGDKEVLNVMSGNLGAGLISVLGYYFGSSNKEKK
jgi:hypothetical protein